MQTLIDLNETVKKRKKPTHIHHAKSSDCLVSPQLKPPEIKLLLRLYDEDDQKKVLSSRQVMTQRQAKNQINRTILKQELLVSKNLFDPFRYFGSSKQLNTIEQANQYHSKQFSRMFSSNYSQQQSRTRNQQLKIDSRKIDFKKSTDKNSNCESPCIVKNYKLSFFERFKPNIGKSPKKYVKQNKQNFLRMNINQVQKVRVKLKLAKK